MPEVADQDVKEFQNESVKSYFKVVSEYASGLGMENIVCLMPVSLQFTDGIISLPTVDEVGTDPYWIEKNTEPYEYVYTSSKEFIQKASAAGKKSHIWLQTWNNKAGAEDEIYLAAEAAYDAGARTILAWSYRGGEACDYKADNCDMVWNITGNAMRRIKDRYIDDIASQRRNALKNK